MDTPIKEAVFERTLNAPVEKIWKAWTDPNLLKEWWGPDNTIITECESDLRVNGRVYIVMEATEGMGPYKGTRWPMEGTYTEIEENKKLSYTAKAWTEGQDGMEIEQVQDLMLTPEGDKTAMLLHAAITRSGPDAQMAIDGMTYGYNQQFDKLEKFLAEN